MPSVNVINVVNQVLVSPPLTTQVAVESSPVTMEIDNGSDASLMTLDDFTRHFLGKILTPSHTILRSVSGVLSSAGESLMKVHYKGKSYELPLIVCKDTPLSPLS